MTSSVALAPEEVARLKAALKEAGIATQDGSSQYEELRVKDGAIFLVLYTSGKVVFNDNDATRELLDRAVARDTDDRRMVAGSDEAGKGEWYGSLVVAAVAISPDTAQEMRLAGVRDSKTLDPRRREVLAGRVREMASAYEVLAIDVADYNNRYAALRIEGGSLNHLLAWAHAKVLRAVLSTAPEEPWRVVVDRFDERKTEQALSWIDRSRVEVFQLEGAEAREPAVAAASILAKDTFDRSVASLEERYGVSLRGSQPKDVPPQVVRKVGKHHFANVAARLKPPSAPSQASLSRWS